MSNTILQGKVSFVNHEKQYVMIEYEVNGKKKTINGMVDGLTEFQIGCDGTGVDRLAVLVHFLHGQSEINRAICGILGD